MTDAFTSNGLVFAGGGTGDVTATAGGANTRVAVFTGSNDLTGDADLTFSGDTLTATNVAISSLTAGRIPFADVAGLLIDDAGLAYSTVDDSLTLDGPLNLAASTTSIPALHLTAGSAPTVPADGDVWLESNTNTGLKIRINGVTKTITLS